jgi:outer membrane protein assembly factor BamB
VAKSRITLILVIAILGISIAAAIATYNAARPPGAVSGSDSSAAGAGSGSLFYTSANSKDWLVYHHDPFRTGFDMSDQTFTSIHRNWTSTRLDGPIYAEPLVAEGKVIVATENNTIYSLDSKTGAVIWRTNLGLPVPRSDLPCGNIDQTGITGTPAVDMLTRTVFAVAFLDSSHYHQLFGLNIDTGAVRLHAVVDPPGSDPLVQQQRGALGILYYNSTSSAKLEGLMVYVPFGGLYGDCGQYHGWVVSLRVPVSVPITSGLPQPSAAIINATSPSSLNLRSFQASDDREVGIWAPSGPAIDHAGNIFVATGNGESVLSYDFGNSVIKLSPSLGRLNWFAPDNWAELNGADADLGSTGPALLGNHNDSSVFQAGKQGIGYILSSAGLDEIFSAPICSGGAYGGTAYAAPYLYVPCRDGLVSLQLHDTPSQKTTSTETLQSAAANSNYTSFSVIWKSPPFWSGPPIVAGGLVWTIDLDNSILYAFQETSGKVAFRYELGSPENHFLTPSASRGQIFVPLSDKIMSFSLK